MATEIIRAIHRWPVAFPVASAIIIGAIIGQFGEEDLRSASVITTSLAMVALFLHVTYGPHKGIAGFGLVTYMLYLFSDTNLYAVSIMTDVVLFLFAVFSTWSYRNAMRNKGAQKAFDQETQAGT
jgi:hypothetical protein